MTEDISLTSEDFSHYMDDLGLDWAGVSAAAVAVSGGPDSMALCGLLAEWAQARDITLHVMSVDHGLREGAAQEALDVGAWLSKAHPTVQHHILKWEDPADSAIQEEARKARYGLMEARCRGLGIAHLFLAHHRDDQAETVLFRLAKGSGLDGLAGMQPVQFYEGVQLVRPLLEISKGALVSYCQAQNIPFAEDPSNQDGAYARVRLRQARAVLEEEGLSAKRLSVTAKRLARARQALEDIADNAFEEAILNKDTKRIVLNLKSLLSMPEEVMLRCVLKGISMLRPDLDYAPRMERVESLVYDLRSQGSFRKRTLAGLIFECSDDDSTLIMTLE
ncbi:MAG: tRNA lysidine(34) synthetase TilS [Pseudomonadota bacterium]